MRRQMNMMVGGMLALVASLLATPAQALDDTAACGAETARQEAVQGIPAQLLHAISLVESGRWNAEHRATLAWPWTVMAEGEGRFLPSKAAAIAEVKALQARGVKNIDVGCMQVNLLAHSTAFKSLDEAFEPATNVAYAARFLMGLYSSTKDWKTAAAYYHSQTPDLAAAYKTKLVATWNTALGKGDNRLQMAALDSGPQNRPPVGMMMMPQAPAPSSARNRLQQVALALPASPAVDVAKEKADALGRTVAERAEAKRIADAYRQARLEEYRLRKLTVAKG